jgi:phage terminase small subunit
MSKKREIFCLEYITDMNATQAAIRAGYSKKTASVIGNENLRIPYVGKKIKELIDKRSERTKVDADWVLKRLADEAEADVADLYDDNGKLKPVSQWPLIWRRGLVAGIETETEVDNKGDVTRVSKVKLSDRVKRLELIGKHIGVKAFEERVAVSGLDSLAERLERAKSRDE